jgi:hypothetical protein
VDERKAEGPRWKGGGNGSKRFGVKWSIMKLISLIIFMSVVSSTAAENIDEFQFNTESDRADIIKARSFPELTRLVSSFNSSNLRRITLCNVLRDEFDNPTGASKLRDLPKDLDRDLSNYRERTVWVFEKLAGLTMPRVLKDGYYDIAACKKVRDDMTSFIADAIKAAEASQRLKLTDLKQKYTQTISMGLIDRKQSDLDPKLGEEGLRAFKRMLLEWFPIGKDLNELEDLMGKKAFVEGDLAMFGFSKTHLFKVVLTENKKIRAIYPFAPFCGTH